MNVNVAILRKTVVLVMNAQLSPNGGNSGTRLVISTKSEADFALSVKPSSIIRSHWRLVPCVTPLLILQKGTIGQVWCSVALRFVSPH